MVKKARKRVYRRKRKNPASRKKYRKARRHRPVVYSIGKGRRRKMVRSPKARLMPRRINRRRRYKRRKNPFSVRSLKLKSYFGRNRLMRGISLLGGIGVGAFGKSFLSSTLGNNMLFNRFGGAVLLVLGAMINTKARKSSVQSIGTGIVAFSIYDLLTQNVPFLTAYLPTIGAPSFNRVAAPVSGGMNYGRSVYGASLPRGGNAEVVSGNISSTTPAEIVGEEMDLSEMLEMGV